jgi:FecR-like protein
MRPNYRSLSLWCLAAFVLLAKQVVAQTEVATVAAVLGTLQIERAGTSQSAGLGVPVFVGDRLKTGVGDRASIVFQDDSVLNLGPETELVIDTQVFEAPKRRYESLLRLIRGTIRNLVSEYYVEPKAYYEIETPTAVVGVRGTEFITRYYTDAEVTEVVGIAGDVNVAGRLAVIGGGVHVGPQYITQVRKGGFPTTPERLSDARFKQYLEGVEIVGTGRRDGLNVLHPLLAGGLASPQDVPQEVSAVGVERSLAPKGTLPSRLSPDVYTNTQPLLDYKNTPPGQVPPGSVTVHY